MLLTGYHGTTQESAKSILKEKQFKLSQSNKEWLGEGIYFYEQFSDASKIFGLEEYGARFDKRIRNAYLKGDYSAIPRITT